MIFNVGAGNGGSVVYLTQAEYDALPDSKLSNNIEYRITDGNMGVATASNLSYDNSFSGLEAVTVQQAVDEVNNSLQWKSLPSVVGTSVIDLPSEYSEFIVDIKVNEYNSFTFSFIKNQLTDTMHPYNNGFWLNSNNGAKCGVMVSKTQVQLNDVRLGEGQYETSSTVSVYYR